MLTITDKKYIDRQLEENRIQFRNEIEPFFLDFKKQLKTEFERHTSALHEDFNHKFTLLNEMLQEKPSRDEVKEMIKKETDPIRDALTQHILFD